VRDAIGGGLGLGEKTWARRRLGSCGYGDCGGSPVPYHRAAHIPPGVRRPSNPQITQITQIVHRCSTGYADYADADTDWREIMAGGGSSEMRELREMVEEVIAEMEARIRELEKLLPAEPKKSRSGDRRQPKSRSGDRRQQAQDKAKKKSVSPSRKKGK